MTAYVMNAQVRQVSFTYVSELIRNNYWPLGKSHAMVCNSRPNLYRELYNGQHLMQKCYKLKTALLIEDRCCFDADPVPGSDPIPSFTPVGKSHIFYFYSHQVCHCFSVFWTAYWNFLEKSLLCQHFHLLGIDTDPESDRHALDADPTI